MFETDEKEEDKKKMEIKILPYPKNKMKIVRNEQYFILDPNRYNINSLMMLIDLKKINKIEEEFEKYPDGLDRLTFIKLMKKEININSSDPYDEIDLIYGLYKLFCEIDLSGDEIMQWSEFTQFMIDRVEGENDSANPENHEGIVEKEMIKYKRYMISDKVIDYNIHKNEVENAIFYNKVDKLFVSEYNSKILKIYNPHTGKCDLNFNIENYFQQKKLNDMKIKMKFNQKKKQNFQIESNKSLTFSVLSMALSTKNIIGLCLSNNKICFFDFNNDLTAECLYEMPTNPLQKKIWYLKDHGIWLSSGRKNEFDKFYYLYELDIEFEKNSNNKNVALYNVGHWHRNIFFENPSDVLDPNYNKGHTDEIMDVCEISKPQLILTACLDGKIRLFNLYEKEFLKIWTNPTESGVKHLIFNPNVDQNGLILASGFEYYISLFGTDLSLDDAYKGKLEGHNSPVVSMIVLGKSYMCASVDSDGFTKIWDCRARQCLQTIPSGKRNIVLNGMIYMTKYNRFCIYGSKMIFFDQKYLESEISKASKKENEINYPIKCEFNKYHLKFFVATLKDLRVYNGVDGDLIYIFKKFLEQDRFDNETKISTFCFDYQHRLIYLGFSNGTVQQFNAGNGSLIKPINEYEIEKDGMTIVKTHHTKDITKMFVFWNNPTGQDPDFVLVTTSLDSEINMYNEKDPENSIKLRGIHGSHKIREKRNEILCMDISRTYNNFATGSTDGLINVWDMELNKMEDTNIIHSYRPGIFNVINLKFLDPYPVLAAIYSNAELFLWGTNPDIQFKGECFFRTIIYSYKTNIVSHQNNCLIFINQEIESLKSNIIHVDECINNCPNFMSIDEDLNDNYKNDTNTQSYLIMGDEKGYLKVIDIYPILKKYNINFIEKKAIQSTFNILKTEEVNAETSLVHNLLKNKEFLYDWQCLYPNLYLYEKKIHEEEIIDLSLTTEDPFTFSTVSKDRRVKIFNEKMEIIGDIYTGINAPNPPLAPWKFKLDWEKLKKDEMEEFLEICNDIELDFGFLKNYKPNEPIPKEDQEIEKLNNYSLFKTSVPIKQNRFKKIVNQEKKEIIEDDNILNESYEAKFIEEMKKKIDGDFCPYGETKGMNEMSRNVIDNIKEGKDVKDLFELPKVERKTIKTDTKKSKKTLSKSMRFNTDSKRYDLYINKYIKKDNTNLHDKLILPLLKYNFNKNDNVKWNNGETEKILANEYYNNAYKESVRLRNHFEDNDSIQKNYKNMWTFVDEYSKQKQVISLKKNYNLYNNKYNSFNK